MTGTYSYYYDENGLRTQKLGAINGTTAQTVNYYYNGSVLIGMTNGSICQCFSYDANGRVVAVDYSTDSGSTYTTYYYLRNAQGDIVKLIDGSGNTVVEYVYDSWGKKLSTTGTLATTLGENQPFRYRGYVYDEETQWYYLQSRYYDPTTGRFISADVYLSTGQGVLGHNAFAYCLNNPVNMNDKAGRRAHGLAIEIHNVFAYDSGYYVPTGDKSYVSPYVRDTLKSAVKIIGENNVQFILDENERLVKALINSKGKAFTYNLIAEYIRSEYKEQYKANLFVSQDRLANEVKEHIEGYYYALGDSRFNPPIAFDIYYMYCQVFKGEQRPYNVFLIAHCRIIDVNLLSRAENLYYYGIWGAR